MQGTLVRPRNEVMSDINELVTFPNGYGVSIQQSVNHYCGENSFETAVMHRTPHDPGHTVCFTKADGVRTYQNWQQVAETIVEVSAYRDNQRCSHNRAGT